MKKLFIFAVVAMAFGVAQSQTPQPTKRLYFSGKRYSICAFPTPVQEVLKRGEGWVRKTAAFYDSTSLQQPKDEHYTAAKKRTVYTFYRYFSALESSLMGFQAESYDVVWDNGKLQYIKLSTLENGEWKVYGKFFPF